MVAPLELLHHIYIYSTNTIDWDESLIHAGARQQPTFQNQRCCVWVPLISHAPQGKINNVKKRLIHLLWIAPLLLASGQCCLRRIMAITQHPNGALSISALIFPASLSFCRSEPCQSKTYEAQHSHNSGSCILVEPPKNQDGLSGQLLHVGRFGLLTSGHVKCI